MTEAPIVRHEVVVRGTPEQAFAAFTIRTSDIKPKEHNLLSSPIESTTFEPYVGGHIVDRGWTPCGRGLLSRSFEFADLVSCGECALHDGCMSVSQRVTVIGCEEIVTYELSIES